MTIFHRIGKQFKYFPNIYLYNIYFIKINIVRCFFIVSLKIPIFVLYVFFITFLFVKHNVKRNFKIYKTKEKSLQYSENNYIFYNSFILLIFKCKK
ncbi:hypothetical protein PFTANZ_05294 [Plasmodium falciparum Tanzania (2000708)]|uniref:Uncharacterized protein n=1 Tax=Plasmodium falciparum Tanzania (2000708) TaxID=1036725 RepID=A0A024VZY7_PLAFA|nr:hypothetical protein PFTANZ_05294 [Plasmodium falciparum Tanzania (2000708)]